MRKRCQGFTLIELMVTCVVFSIIVSATLVGLNFMSRLNVEKENYSPTLAGTMALENFFLRLVNAEQTRIVSGGQVLEFRLSDETGGSRWARFRFDPEKEILYYNYNIGDTANKDEVILRGVKNAYFVQDFRQRISLELVLYKKDAFQTAFNGGLSLLESKAYAVDTDPDTSDTVKLRTSVSARNIPTPRARIN